MKNEMAQRSGANWQGVLEQKGLKQTDVKAGLGARKFVNYFQHFSKLLCGHKI